MHHNHVATDVTASNAEGACLNRRAAYLVLPLCQH